MTELSLPQAIDRLKSNEARINSFTNGNADGFYTASGGEKVETLPSLVSRLAAAIAQANAARADLAAATGAGLIGYGDTTVATKLDSLTTSVKDALPKAGGIMTGPLVLRGNPANALEAAPKQYVDSVASAIAQVGADYQEFTESGTWTKPAGCHWVYVELVGAGAGGGWTSASSTTSYYAGIGGGGGDFNSMLARAADVPDSLTVTVGVGGTGGTSSPTGGTAGGDSSFGSLVIAKGGQYIAGSVYSTDRILKQSTIGGAGGMQRLNSSSQVVTPSSAQPSQKGGGGGGCGYTYNSNYYSLPGASSDEAGYGGAGNTSSTTAGTDGGYPGGGGGGCSGGTKAGAGGNGRVRVWCW